LSKTELDKLYTGVSNIRLVLQTQSSIPNQHNWIVAIVFVLNAFWLKQDPVNLRKVSFQKLQETFHLHYCLKQLMTLFLRQDLNQENLTKNSHLAIPNTYW